MFYNNPFEIALLLILFDTSLRVPNGFRLAIRCPAGRRRQLSRTPLFIPSLLHSQRSFRVWSHVTPPALAIRGRSPKLPPPPGDRSCRVARAPPPEQVPRPADRCCPGIGGGGGQPGIVRQSRLLRGASLVCSRSSAGRCRDRSDSFSLHVRN